MRNTYNRKRGLLSQEQREISVSGTKENDFSRENKPQ